MKIATVTIKGTKSLEIDGLYMGDFPSTMVFKLTNEGHERDGKLYRTFDTAYLSQLLGFVRFNYTTKYFNGVRM